jgi:BirA family biotin operon repressor/biotin-[acetyl-CoA-carboxylase] ligase
LAIKIFWSTDDNVRVMDVSSEIRSSQWSIGWHVSEVAETASTNADLLEAAAAGAPDRSVLRTDHQTAGRGRLDRRWEAPPGANLLVSILFRAVPEHPGELTRRVAIAAVDACRALTGADVVLKWPNDLLLDGRKLAGILAQIAADGSVVVGLGLNVAWAPDGAATLADAGAAAVTPRELLVALLTAFDDLDDRGDDVDARYRERLATLGARVSVELPDRVVEGTATGVEPDGRLVVIDVCGMTHRLDVGDVVHLRAAAPPPPI